MEGDSRDFLEDYFLSFKQYTNEKLYNLEEICDKLASDLPMVIKDAVNEVCYGKGIFRDPLYPENLWKAEESEDASDIFAYAPVYDEYYDPEGVNDDYPELQWHDKIFLKDHQAFSGADEDLVEDYTRAAIFDQEIYKKKPIFDLDSIYEGPPLYDEECGLVDEVLQATCVLNIPEKQQDEVAPIYEEDTVTDEEKMSPETLNGLEDSTEHTVFELSGLYEGRKIRILIDGGSSHNLGQGQNTNNKETSRKGGLNVITVSQPQGMQQNESCLQVFRIRDCSMASGVQIKPSLGIVCIYFEPKIGWIPKVDPWRDKEEDWVGLNMALQKEFSA